jgi:hypothetical protein
LWHLPLQHLPVLWKSISKNGEQVTRQNAKGFISELYGEKKPCEIIIFQANENEIITEFEIRS